MSRKNTKKPAGTRKVDPCGYKLESVTSLALSLYLREQGGTDQEVIDRCTDWFKGHGEPERVGKSQRVFVLAPPSERKDRTMPGRGHESSVDRSFAPCRYFAKINLDRVHPLAVVPNYFPAVIQTTTGSITKSELVTYLKERADAAA